MFALQSACHNCPSLSAPAPTSKSQVTASMGMHTQQINVQLFTLLLLLLLLITPRAPGRWLTRMLRAS